MAITFLPTRTEGSGPEDLGQAKSNAQPYTDPNVQLAAVNFNNLADFLIALAAEVGLTDGSTPDSIRENLDNVNAEVFAHVGVGGGQHPVAIAAGAAGFMSGADKTKLDGVEALADVTDAANVAAAGAVMTSRTLTAGVGLTGGGDLSANRSFAVDIAGTAPPAIAAAGSVGSSGKVSDRDHTHAHGAQTDATMHARASASAHGFLDSGDYDRILGDAKNQEVLFRDEFTSNLDTSKWTGVVAGTSAAVSAASPGSGSYGACRLYCGTTSTGSAELSTTSAFFYSGRYSSFRFRSKLQISVLSNGTDEFDLFVGYSGQNGVSFSYDRNTSLNWQRTTWVAGVPTHTDTGVVVAAATTVDLTWIWTPAAGGTVEFFINGVSVGSATGKSFSAVFLSPGRMVKSAGSGGPFTYIDFTEAVGTLVTPRP
jgi:hypothetical protein